MVWLLVASVSSGTTDDCDGHLRARDSQSAAAMAEGLRRSHTFVALLQTVEASRFVVYVESSRTLKKGMNGCLVHGTTGLRYMRVVVKTGLPLDKRIEVLAHELQHVREVIEAGILNDPVAMARLFRRI